jgi:predicted DNA-binding protein
MANTTMIDEHLAEMERRYLAEARRVKIRRGTKT